MEQIPTTISLSTTAPARLGFHLKKCLVERLPSNSSAAKEEPAERVKEGAKDSIFDSASAEGRSLASSSPNVGSKFAS